ncbi:MAG: hypothetical protein H6672_00015 [Anaerolineaceae bacterium]|nr:hypothetical protein [Anaerolineaceae bacterium]
MAEEPIRIFYSWQSWTPGARNREFIEEALKQALAQIEETHGQPLIIDRDTQNLPGAPAIADSILKKIEQCDIFLADVTIVLQNDEHASPNPNVMLELGYAVKCLTWDRVILVMNKTLGSPENLPFDLGHRRWPLSYELDVGQQKAPVRDQLVGGLKVAIETILHYGLPAVGESITDTIERFIEQGENVSLDRLIRRQIEQVYQKTSSDAFFEERHTILANHKGARRDIWNVGFNLYFPGCRQELDVFLSLCWYGHPDQARYVSNAIKRWMEKKANDPQPLISWRYVPSLFLTYLAGIAAVGNQNWSYLAAALRGNPTRHPYQPGVIDYASEAIIEKLIYPYTDEQRSHYSTAGAPIGKPMQDALQPLIERFLPSQSDFSDAFIIFEFLFALHHLHARIGTDLPKPLLPRYAIYRSTQDHPVDSIIPFLENGGKQGDRWGVLAAGLFDGSSERFVTVLTTYQERFERAYSSRPFEPAIPDYLRIYQSNLAQ